MPSKKPFLVVRVTPERMEQVKRIARGCGMPYSQWVNAILDDIIPMSEKAMEAAQLGDEARDEFLGHLSDVATAAKAEAEKLKS